MLLWLLGALALGAFFCLGVVLTATVIRNFRSRRDTKVFVADMETIIRNMPDKEKHSVSFDDLEKCKGKQFVSEFDPYTNEIIKSSMCDRGMDSQVRSVVDSHGGYVIVG